jgi:hypothetical protein
MTLVKYNVADEHRALLALVSSRTGKSKSALVREALELHLPSLLLAQRPEPATPQMRNAAGLESHGATPNQGHIDHAPLQ